jgi:hypothetical protein
MMRWRGWCRVVDGAGISRGMIGGGCRKDEEGVIYGDQRRMDLWGLFGMRDRWGRRVGLEWEINVGEIEERFSRIERQMRAVGGKGIGKG